MKNGVVSQEKKTIWVLSQKDFSKDYILKYYIVWRNLKITF
jgi:hypothetical protein